VTKTEGYLTLLAVFWEKAINFHLLGTAHYCLLKLSGEGKTCPGSPARLLCRAGPYYSICWKYRTESTSTAVQGSHHPKAGIHRETENHKTTELQGPCLPERTAIERMGWDARPELNLQCLHCLILGKLAPQSLGFPGQKMNLMISPSCGILRIKWTEMKCVNHLGHGLANSGRLRKWFLSFPQGRPRNFKGL